MGCIGLTNLWTDRSNQIVWSLNSYRSECAAVIGRTHEPQPGPSSQQLSAPTSGIVQHYSFVVWKSCTRMPICCSLDNLWEHLDFEVGRPTKRVTAEAIQEVQRYMAEGNIARSQDPLRSWDNQKANYSNLYQMPLQFLCTPASSAPCERVFSTAEEVVSEKRNRFNFKTLEKLIFFFWVMICRGGGEVPVHKHPHSQHFNSLGFSRNDACLH